MVLTYDFSNFIDTMIMIYLNMKIKLLMFFTIYIKNLLIIYKLLNIIYNTIKYIIMIRAPETFEAWGQNYLLTLNIKNVIL